MALTATGLGSGLDINNIVKVLVEAQQLPKEAIYNKSEQTINAKLSAFGSLKSALSEFQNVIESYKESDILSPKKVSVGDTNLISAEADGDAQIGEFEIEVVRVATRHKAGSAFLSDSSTAVGEGIITIASNGESFDITVDPTDDMYDVANKINNHSENDMVAASNLTTENGARIVFTSKKTGTSNALNISAVATNGSGLANTFNGGNISTLNAAQYSVMKIDGLQVSSQSNQYSSALTGVTINLLEAHASDRATLIIEDDKAPIKANITKFVDAYNSLMKSINGVSRYNSTSKTSSSLQGDSMVRSLVTQIRSVVATQSNSNSLYDIGISIDQYGTMNINNAKLEDAIDNKELGGLFANDQTGIAEQFDTMIDNYVKSTGIISGREKSYQNEMTRLEEGRERFNLKMEFLQSRLTKQFNTMDLIVAKFNQQSAGLIERLNSLPGVVNR